MLIFIDFFGIWFLDFNLWSCYVTCCFVMCFSIVYFLVNLCRWICCLLFILAWLFDFVVCRWLLLEFSGGICVYARLMVAWVFSFVSFVCDFVVLWFEFVLLRWCCLFGVR